MAKRYHQRQTEEMMDDGYEWGSHRGGGGSPLRNADGRPISKLGTVINGNTVVDVEKYNGMGTASTSSGISIREITRPNTSYHTPTHNNSRLFDPSPPANGVNSSVPITPIRLQNKGQSSQLQQLQQQQRQGHGQGDSNVTEVITHNLQKSNRLRVTNLVQEHQQQPHHPPHHPPPSQHQPPSQHPPLHRKHLTQHDDQENHSRKDKHHHVDRPPSADHAHSHSHDGVFPQNSKLQEELLHEMSSLKMITKKQTLLQSLRWGLANLDLADDCNCIGNKEGEEVEQKPLRDVLKAALLAFLRGKAYNIGIRRLLHYKKEHDKGQTEDKFLAVVSENLHLLCGAEPSFSRRQDGDCDVFIGVANY